MTTSTTMTTSSSPVAPAGALQEMFDLQKALQLRVHGDVLPDILPHRIPMTVTSLIAELGEVLEDEQNWKDWKKNPLPVDRDHLRMEIADAWHFMINLTLQNGFDAAEIHAEFLAKNAENHARQDRGY